MTTVFPQKIRLVIACIMVLGMALLMADAGAYLLKKNRKDTKNASNRVAEPSPHDTAIADLMAKLKENSNDSDTLFALGKIFFDAEEYTRASSFFSKAIISAPSAIQPRYWQSVTLYRQGKYPEAAEVLEGLIALEESPETLYNLGVIYAYHLDKKAKAKELFEKVLTMPETTSATRVKVKQTVEALP